MNGKSSPEGRPERGEFLLNVHLFRGVAILAVVATHVLFELSWTPEHQREFKVCLSLVQNGTTWFVFLAGLLFKHLAHRFDYRTYLLGKFKYVIVPYVLVSLPYVFIQYTRGFGIFGPTAIPAGKNPVLHVLERFLSGSQMPIPLWFVPMIAVFYLAAPLLLWLSQRKWGYWTIPPLLVLASFIHRPLDQTLVRQTVVYFFPVYLVGMWVAQHMTTAMNLARRYRWWAVFASLALVVFEVYTRKRPGALESARPFSMEMGVFDVNIYMKLLLSLVVLEALRRCPKWLERCLDPLAKYSFGVFFVHFYWLYFARDWRLKWGWSWPGSPFVLVALTLGTVALSIALVWLIQRVLGRRSRFIVGC